MSDHPNQPHHQHHHQQQQRRSWSRGSPSPIHYRPPSPWAPSPPILASPGGLRFTGRGSPASPMFGSHEQRGSRGPHLQHPRPRRPEHEPSPARPPSVPPHYQPLERQSPATVMYQRPALRQASPAGFMSPPIYREFEYAAEPPPPGTLPTPQAYIIYDDEEDTGPTTAEIIANQSQDYIDEKLAQYQTTILQLQGMLTINFFCHTFHAKYVHFPSKCDREDIDFGSIYVVLNIKSHCPVPGSIFENIPENRDGNARYYFTKCNK